MLLTGNNPDLVSMYGLDAVNRWHQRAAQRNDEHVMAMFQFYNPGVPDVQLQNMWRGRNNPAWMQMVRDAGMFYANDDSRLFLTQCERRRRILRKRLARYKNLKKFCCDAIVCICAKK